MRRASHSRDAELVSLMTSFASTGMATGRLITGSRTMTAAITQLLPYPVFAGPGAEPSWNHDAAHTFFPRRSEQGVVDRDDHRLPGGHQQRHHQPRHGQAQLVGVPAGAGEEPVRPVVAPAAGHRPAPASMPHTVRFPGWARNPQARPQNVRNDGAVNNGAKHGQQRHQRRGNR